MADGIQMAAGRPGGSGGPQPERRQHPGMDQKLADLRAELLDAIRDGDDAGAAHLREDMRELETRVNAGQAAVLARLDSQDATLAGQNTMLAGIADSMGKISTTLGTHDQFVHEKQEEEAEQVRLEAEQAMRATLLAEIDAKKEKKRADRQAAWGRIQVPVLSIATAVASGSLLYLLNNLNNLRFNAQTQGITVAIGAVIVLLWIVYRARP